MGQATFTDILTYLFTHTYMTILMAVYEVQQIAEVVFLQVRC